MPQDPKITKAKKVLKDGIKVGDELRADPALTRSTATRQQYKAKAEAAERALAILNGK